jgi:hypothetical protein
MGVFGAARAPAAGFNATTRTFCCAGKARTKQIKKYMIDIGFYQHIIKLYFKF